MAMELARSRTGSTVPEEERVRGRRVGSVGCPEPGAGTQQKVCQLRQAEVQGLMVLEQDQAMARLAVLEQIAGGDRMLPLNPALECRSQVRRGLSGGAPALTTAQPIPISSLVNAYVACRVYHLLNVSSAVKDPHWQKSQVRPPSVGSCWGSA